MTTEHDPLGPYLEALGRTTEGIRPSIGFEQRISAAIAREERERICLQSSGRWLIPAAALLAVLSLSWAARAQTIADETIVGVHAFAWIGCRP